MSGRARLESFLRTPRGVLSVLALCLAASAAIAMGLAGQRDFFERHVRETYPPPSALLADLGRGLDRADGAARVRALSAEERRMLYTTWIQIGGSWPPAAARTMVTADPETFLDAAFQTLIAGSPEQSRRAAQLLALSGHPGGRKLLAEAAARAEARHETDLAAFLRAALHPQPVERRF